MVRVDVSCKARRELMVAKKEVQNQRWKSDEIDALGTMRSVAFPFEGSSGSRRKKQKGGALITALAGGPECPPIVGPTMLV